MKTLEFAESARQDIGSPIKRAACHPWPHLWHNFRATRQTELMELSPAHVASAWLGNSERIAPQRDREVLNSHFEKAACIPARDARKRCF